MKRFFLVLLVFIATLLDREVISQKDEFLVNGELNLKAKNFNFLLDFFKQDSAKTKNYWGAIKSGLMSAKIVFVNVQNQELNVLGVADTFRAILRTRISSGAQRGSTPKGEFEILKKKLRRPSYSYGGVMIFWNCLTSDEAFGIHGLKDKSYQKNLGQPVSHGCIRVSVAVAKNLYTLAPIGTKVIIE